MKLPPLSLLLFCLFVAACDESKKPETLDSHEVATPIVKDASYRQAYVAEIHSVKYVELRSKINGHIDTIHVDEGQAVKAGQLLFTLSAVELEKELQKTQALFKNALADLKAAEVEMANVRQLVDKNIVSKTELEVAKAKMEALQADVEHAKADQEQTALELSFAQIKAPFGGVINRIPNKVGSLIAQGDMLTSLSDNREIFAYFNLSEIDYLNYISAGTKKHHTVHLKLANDAPYGHEGQVEMIESEFDRATGNIAFRARFPNPDGILKHGANGKIEVEKSVKNALLIPQKSTFEIQDKVYVYVVKPDGTLKQRNIIPKMRLPDYYLVESGLSKDETFLLEGAENVKDGEKIHPVPVDLAAAMAQTEE